MADKANADTMTDTTPRQEGHEVRSEENARNSQRAADQAEARSGTLLPEHARPAQGSLPDGDSAPIGGIAKLAAAEAAVKEPTPSPPEQEATHHFDPLVGKGRDYLQPQHAQPPRVDPMLGQHETALEEPASAAATIPPAPARPQLSRDHQAVLDYMVQYVDWRLSLPATSAHKA